MSILGMKSYKKVQNVFKHGNGMVIFELGFEKFLLPLNF